MFYRKETTNWARVLLTRPVHTLYPTPVVDSSDNTDDIDGGIYATVDDLLRHYAESMFRYIDDYFIGAETSRLNLHDKLKIKSVYIYTPIVSTRRVRVVFYIKSRLIPWYEGVCRDVLKYSSSCSGYRSVTSLNLEIQLTNVKRGPTSVPDDISTDWKLLARIDIENVYDIIYHEAPFVNI